MLTRKRIQLSIFGEVVFNMEDPTVLVRRLVAHINKVNLDSFERMIADDRLERSFRGVDLVEDANATVLLDPLALRSVDAIYLLIKIMKYSVSTTMTKAKVSLNVYLEAITTGDNSTAVRVLRRRRLTIKASILFVQLEIQKGLKLNLTLLYTIRLIVAIVKANLEKDVFIMGNSLSISIAFLADEFHKGSAYMIRKRINRVKLRRRHIEKPYRLAN